MRSRDGDSTFIRIIYTILLTTLSLHAQEYLISYRYVVDNSLLYNQTLDISRAMTKCQGEALEPFFLEYNKTKTFKQNLLENEEVFLHNIGKIGLHLEHRSQTHNFMNHSRTILTLKTTCFKVDFNDSLAIITPLK